jgi:O-antigen ligase
MTYNSVQVLDAPVSVKSGFRENCDVFSKQCAVLLGFTLPISTFATHVVLSFLIIAWFLAGNLKEKVDIILHHPVVRLILILFGVFIIGALYSRAPRADSLWMVQKMGKLLYIPFLLPIMQEKKWRRAALLAFLSAMLLTFGLSLLKVYGGVPIGVDERFTTACVFKDHIFTNLMMAFASFMVAHYCLNQTNILMRVLLGILLIGLVFYVLFMSAGRSGYVVFVALWLLLGLQKASFKGLAIGLLGLLMLLSFAYVKSDAFQGRLLVITKNVAEYHVGNVATSVGERLEFLNQTWQLSKQRPWFGYGTGSFKGVYQTHAAENHLRTTDNPHNEYLHILFQLGIFGLAAFLGLFFFLSQWTFLLSGLEKWFAQGMIVAMAVGCFANSWLMDFTSGYFFVFIIACCFGALNLKKDVCDG